MRHDLPTMAEIFLDSGYRTGHFGKWHLGDSYPHRPLDRGFEETIHHGAWGITSIADFWGNDYWDDTYKHNRKLERYQGNCTDVWFDEAMAWMKKPKDAGQPFFCYLPTNYPHSPHWADKSYLAPYEREGLPTGFFWQIANIDDNMGRLVDMLEATGLAENTIVIFMTDNSTARGDHVFNAGMRRNKTELWEGGHRVPFWIRWPAGGVGKPRDIDELTHSQDLLPTLIDLCALSRPDGATFDGVILTGLLRGTQTQLAHRKLVVQYGEPKKWECAVLWKKWRLVGFDQLYDLRTDPHQDKNIAADYPEVLKALRDHYKTWWSSAIEEYQRVKYLHIGSERSNPMVFYSSDWKGAHADNFNQMAEGNRIGYWDVVVEAGGEYEFKLLRWPIESRTPLAGPMGKGKAVPIAKTRLKIGNVDVTQETSDGDTHATFHVELKKGKTRVYTWFLDKDGKELCSGYQSVVRWKP